MTVLMWDKPEKIMTTEQWQSISADCAPPGVYTPNMSDEDAERWKAKLKYAKTDHPQVEIRKSAWGAQMLFIVGLDGWTYKPSGHVVGETPEGEVRYPGHTPSGGTSGYNVRLSMNGPARFTWEDFAALHAAVQEARTVLDTLKKAG